MQSLKLYQNRIRSMPDKTTVKRWEEFTGNKAERVERAES